MPTLPLSKVLVADVDKSDSCVQAEELTLSELNLACKAALLGAVVVSVAQEALKAVSYTFSSV